MNNLQFVFVYNASSDLFSTVTDFAHKILSPSTYECRLCVLTYGSFSMKQEWKSFIESLPIKTVFLHKDDFEKQYKIQALLPAAYVSTKAEIKEIITKQEIDSCKDLEQLKNMVTQKFNEYVQHHHTGI